MNFARRHIPAAFLALVWSAAANAQMPVAHVVVEQAKLSNAPTTITLVGTVYASRVSNVASEIEGIVAVMPVRQGDHVERGGLLCKLNDEALSYRLAEQQGQLESRRAQHAELVAGTRVEELTRLKALLDETDTNYDRWKFEMDRVNRLFEGQDANEKELKDTRASFFSAKRRKIAAEAIYHQAVAGPRKEAIARAAYDVAAQEAVVRLIEGDLRKTAILAPYTGYITNRQTEQGEWVTAGGSIVELADLSRVLVRVDAPESILQYLALGSPARVWIDALGRSFDGSIKHVIRSADLSARTFPVEIEVANPNGMLAAGQFARVTVPAGKSAPVVTVPKDAIVERDGVTYIGIVMPGREGGSAAMLRAVTLGADVGEWIAITSGNLRPGSRIVTRGTERILPFPNKVVIVDEAGTPIAADPQPGGSHQKPATSGHGDRKADAGNSH